MYMENRSIYNACHVCAMNARAGISGIGGETNLRLIDIVETIDRLLGLKY